MHNEAETQSSLFYGLNFRYFLVSTVGYYVKYPSAKVHCDMWWCISLMVGFTPNMKYTKELTSGMNFKLILVSPDRITCLQWSEGRAHSIGLYIQINIMNQGP